MRLAQRPFERLGDVSRWLVSEAFDLLSPRSREAEVLIEQAEILVDDEDASAQQALELTQKLESVLGGIDPFWSRWRFAGAQRGWWALPEPGQPVSKPAARKRNRT